MVLAQRVCRMINQSDEPWACTGPLAMANRRQQSDIVFHDVASALGGTLQGPSVKEDLFDSSVPLASVLCHRASAPGS
jgi:hypothetical protein